MEVAEAMEKELNKPKAKPQNILNDDQAVAAYAEFMSTDGSNLLVPDPAKILEEKKKKEEAE